MLRLDSKATGWQAFCADHTGDACNCVLAPAPRGVTERLDEMEFQRSACAAAQSGDVVKLGRILDRNPDAVHSDGASGACLAL